MRIYRIKTVETKVIKERELIGTRCDRCGKQSEDTERWYTLELDNRWSEYSDNFGELQLADLCPECGKLIETVLEWKEVKMKWKSHMEEVINPEESDE